MAGISRITFIAEVVQKVVDLANQDHPEPWLWGCALGGETGYFRY